MYGIMSLNKLRFFTRSSSRGDPVDQSALRRPRTACRTCNRWHPFNRQMYLGARIMLPGHLLASKGDRIAMHSSVETRYAFLDEDVVAFMAKLHPRWKLRGVLQGQVRRTESGRALAAEGSRLAAQEHVPRPDGYLGRRLAATASLDRPGTISRIARRRRGTSIRDAVAAARREAIEACGRGLAANQPGNGPHRRDRDATVAPPVHRRWICADLSIASCKS